MPQIPLAAVFAAPWLGYTEGDKKVLPIKVKKDKAIEIKVQRAPTGFWRVVEVTNLRVFLPMLQRYLSRSQSVPE
jgi:hypothetical protein